MILSAFGGFWTGEGLGVDRLAQALALLAFVVVFLALGVGRLLGARTNNWDGCAICIIVNAGRELVSMFLADVRLTLATYALVITVAALIGVLHTPPPVGGCVLDLSCIAILVEGTIREARRPQVSSGRG